MHARFGRFAVALAVGAAIFASTGNAGAADPSPTTTVVVASTTVDNLTHKNLIIPCPAGTFAVGGGNAQDEPASDPQLLVTSSSPAFGGKFLVTMADGPQAAPDGWVISMYNESGSTKTFKGGAICATPGRAVGPVSTVVASAALPVGPSENSATAECPGSLQAVGGGVDDSSSGTDFIETSAPLVGSSHIYNLPGTSASDPNGWTAKVANTGKTADVMKVAVLCADQTGRPTITLAWGSTAAGAFETGGTCPVASEVTSGGIDRPDQQELEQLGPVFSNNSTLEQTADGPTVAAVGWDGLFVGSPAKPVPVTAVCVGPLGGKPVTRLSGADRLATAIAISTDSFPAGNPAGAVVLARSDPGQYADALVGTPLAARKKAPLLLTPGESLDPRTQSEISRILPPGGTVYLLGGESALSPAVAASLTSLGFVVIRYGGTDRFDTAAQIAAALGNPPTILEATGLNFPDALSAGAAAAVLGGAVLLTEDGVQAPPTAAYLTAHPPTKRYGVGAQAASADPGATPVAGVDRYDTAARVADLYPFSPPAFGAALGTNYPDALGGGAHIAAKAGPLLLVAGSGPLPAPTQAWLVKHGASIARGYLYGGTAAVGDDVAAELAQASA